MKVPRWMRKPNNEELLTAKRAALHEAVATERANLQTSIYETEREIHAATHNLEFQRQRLDFLDATYPVLPRFITEYPEIRPEAVTAHG